MRIITCILLAAFCVLTGCTGAGGRAAATGLPAEAPAAARVHDSSSGAPTNQTILQLREAAEQGDALAQQRLGRAYAMGEGVAPDPAQSFKWSRLAAEKGNAEAQYQLGHCYADGFGTARDPAQGARWYEKAAQQGHPIAQFKLRFLLLGRTGGANK